jgi:hypothetical protein
MALRDLLYFNPDPAVPDADLLGYGDLVYSDGSTQYIPGNDPELIAGLPGPPPGVNPVGSIGMGPPQAPPQMGPPPPPQMPPPVQIDGANGPVQMDVTGNLSPITRGLNSLGNMVTGGRDSGQGGAGLGDMLGGAASSFGSMMGGGMGQQQGNPQGPPPVTIQSEQGPVTIDPTGNIQPGDGGVPFEQLQQEMGGMGAGGMGSGGMIPVQREGALPPDLAARQMGEMGAMNAQTLAATEQARRDETRIYNELLLKQMAANDGERMKREQDVADNQARAERLHAEFQRTNEVQLDQSVRGAMGDFGGTLGIIGAMLQGAVGNDSGFRMLERNVDRFVNDQVRRKGTALSMLANQFDSTQQAIAAGKASLYKVSADRLELLAQKAKSDVYEAQTPAVIQSLRQKQQEEMQKFEQLSLGKTLEKAPLPPKPPSPEQLQKYGELRRERVGNNVPVQRVEQQLGLIWEPGRSGQPGRYRNEKEVLDRGIQGVGSLEQLMPDLVYSMAGKAGAEGYELRGAAEALAYAQIRQMQPTGPISNMDAKIGALAASMKTEEGLLQGLARLRQGDDAQLAQDAAEFSPQVVAEYERRRQAAGGSPIGQMPAAARPATVEEMRRGAAAGRGGQGPQSQNAPQAIPAEPSERMALVNESVASLAPDLPPEGWAILVAQAAHESGDGDSMGAANGNMWGHKQTGGRPGFSANTTEGEGAGARRLKQNFASYPSIADATADHLSLIKRRYPRAWEALEVGDADAYVAALKDGNYFTANEDAYRKAILRRL